MEYDRDKVDQYILALLYLVRWQDGPASRAWKGFDWALRGAKGWKELRRKSYETFEG